MAPSRRFLNPGPMKAPWMTTKEVNRAMSKTITFTCTECGEMFEESVQAFTDAPGESVMAPALCRDCGHGDEG